MRLIIAGSRHLSADRVYPLLLDAWGEVARIDTALLLNLTVFSGACPTGVDAVGEQWAKSMGFYLARFPADWVKLGRSAGPIRNREMAHQAAKEPGGTLILIWDGKSPGSKSMKQEAERAGLRIIERRIDVPGKYAGRT